MSKPPRLEPKQLFEKRVARDKSRLKAYNQILGQIHSRIYHTSQLPGNSNFLVYTVPPFLLGMPSIDLQDCIIYLVHMLRQSGFEIRFTYPNLLYISWKHYETEYNRQQNPIVQAMIPPQATTKKGAGGKRGMGADSSPGVTFNPIVEYSTGNQAQPRSANEYRPPDSFLQNLSRPPPRPMPPVVPNQNLPKGDILADLWKFA